MNENFAQLAKQRKIRRGPTDLYLYQALNAHLSAVKGKLSAACDSPWDEAILTEFDSRPVSFLPSLQEESLDVLVAIGNLDPFLYDEDFSFMESAKNATKREGLLFLSVPVGKQTLSPQIRIYNGERLKQLFKGWRILGYFGFSYEDLDVIRTGNPHRPIFVLQKK